MLYLAFFVLINFSHSKNLSSSSKKETPQVKSIMSRLQFSIKNGTDIKIKETVSTYFKTPVEDKKKIDFIVSLMNQKTKKDKKATDIIKRKIFILSTELCKPFQCLLLFQSLPKIKTDFFNKSLRNNLFKIFKIEYYPPEFKKNSFVIRLFNQLIQDDKKNLERISGFAINFPVFHQFLDKKLIEYKKQFGNEKWFKKRQCRLFILKENHKKARKTCFPIKNFFYYNEFLSGKKITETKVNEIVKSIGYDKSWILMMKLFYLKNKAKVDLSKFNLEKAIYNYSKGYFLIKLGKAYKVIDNKQLNRLTKKYIEIFKGSLLAGELNGSVKPKQLRQIFGKSSFFYQLSILKGSR